MLMKKNITGLSEQGKKLIDEFKELKNFEESNNFEENNENIFDKKIRTKKIYKMTEEEKEINRKILKNMNRKQNFVKNPRFRNNGKFMLYSNAMFSNILSTENPFVVEPIIVTFRDYQLNGIYQIDVKLTNRKNILTSFKYIPPESQNFSIRKIIYPKKDTSLIAPGMFAKIEVMFNAISLDNFEDEISIITETYAFKIPLRAIRESPALSLDNPMITGKCLLGDQCSMVFRCKNNGGDAHFKFSAKDELLNSSHIQTLNSNTNIQSNVSQNLNENNNSLNNTNGVINYNTSNSHNQDNEVLNIGPFSIFPQEFYLYKGMSVEIYVNFSPKTEGLIEKELNICCDSKINLNQKIIGEGIIVDFKIISLDGIPVNESLEKLENIFFDDAFTSTTTSRIIKLKNMSSINLNYHWSIYDNFSKSNFSIDKEEEYFSIIPISGIFEPSEEISFEISFTPKNSRNYEQRLDFVIEDIPFQSIKGYDNRILNSKSNMSFNTKESKNKNLFNKGEPFMIVMNSPYPSFPFFSFNLKGKGKQTSLEVDSKIINFGLVYINETVKNSFFLSNSKSGYVKFRIPQITQYLKGGNLPYENNSITKVNNFFKWSEPGSTVTDHFRTDCIFKLKKSNEKDNFFKEKNIETPRSQEMTIEEVENLKLYNNQQNLNKNQDSIKINQNTNIFSNRNSEININENFNEQVDENFEKNNSLMNPSRKNSSSILINNKALNLITKMKERENIDKNNLLLNNVNFLKLFTKSSFLFESNELRKSKTRSQTENKKWTEKIKSDKILDFSDEKKTNLKEKIIFNPLNTHFENRINKSKAEFKEKIIKREKSCETKKTKFSKLNNNNETINPNINNIKNSNFTGKDKINNRNNLEPFTNKNFSRKISRISGNSTNNINSNINFNFNMNLNNKLLVEDNSNNEKNKNEELNLTNISKNKINFQENKKYAKSKILTSENDTIEDVEIEENLELIINRDEKMEIQVSFLPKRLGFFKSSIIISPDDGIPFSIDFNGLIIGPKLEVNTPCVDLGLFGINEIRKEKFIVKNSSRTSAKFLIKDTRFKNINFENLNESEYKKENEGIISKIKERKKINNLEEFENYGMLELDMNVRDNYELKFDPIIGEIPEGEEKEITVK